MDCGCPGENNVVSNSYEPEHRVECDCPKTVFSATWTAQRINEEYMGLSGGKPARNIQTTSDLDGKSAC